MVKVGDMVVLDDKMAALRDMWEETSFQLEMLQTNQGCAEQEREGLRHRKAPPFKLTFDPSIVHIIPKGNDLSALF